MFLFFFLPKLNHLKNSELTGLGESSCALRSALTFFKSCLSTQMPSLGSDLARSYGMLKCFSLNRIALMFCGINATLAAGSS